MWKCPGRGLKSIIDYFLVRTEMKRNVNNVKVVRGAEIGSDHHLVLMKVRLHRRVLTRKVEERSRLNTERLATKEGKMAYQIRLKLKLNGAKWVNGSDVEGRRYDDLVLVAENEEDIKRNAQVLNEVM